MDVYHGATDATSAGLIADIRTWNLFHKLFMSSECKINETLFGYNLRNEDIKLRQNLVHIITYQFVAMMCYD